MRTCRFISILLLISLLPCTAFGKSKKDTTPKEKAPLLSGAGVGIDICGFAMKGVNARFANMEICGRLGLKEKFFPIFEIGIGDCTKHGGETSNVFSTRSPYWRIGMDYNVNKKINGNRMLVGFRYGFTSYKYDYTSPDFTDPVYGITRPLELEGMKGNNQWLELCVGFETKLWSIVRLGYNVRYKLRTMQDVPKMGEPYFVPGFGKNDDNTFGGTVYLTFDIGKSAASGKHISLFGKRKKKGEEAQDENNTVTSPEENAPRAAKRRGGERIED